MMPTLVDHPGMSSEQPDRRKAGFVQDGRWWLLRDETARLSPQDGCPDLGQPGLWKTVLEGNQPFRIFELHDSVLTFASSSGQLGCDDDEQSVTDGCLAWALATGVGIVPPGWQPPPLAEVEAFIPQGRLTIVSGLEARQGELILSPVRLALRFPVVTPVPADLPEPRPVWLRQILFEAQNHWRLVRFGFSNAAHKTAVIAEVDLTGAPHAVLEPLLSTSLDSLHAAVNWLVETAVLLAHATVACRALEHGPNPQTQPKGNNT